MPEIRVDQNPLRALFRAALDRAFREHGELYSPAVAEHLSDDVLCDFVHVDRIYRLRNAQGRPVEELPLMLEVASSREGPERRLEVDAYIGDFTLFTVGFFPASLTRGRWASPQALVSKVGGLFVKFDQPVDYYTAEGRNAYRRAAETARLFAPDIRETYTRLSSRYESYLALIRKVKELIADDPEIRRIETSLE